MADVSGLDERTFWGLGEGEKQSSRFSHHNDEHNLDDERSHYKVDPLADISFFSKEVKKIPGLMTFFHLCFSKKRRGATEELSSVHFSVKKGNSWFLKKTHCCFLCFYE